jgi:DNA-binding HxlR family transcriptional regulator
MNTHNYQLHILDALKRGPMRFNALQRAVNVPNPPVMAKHLKKMQSNGQIKRNVLRIEPPAHIEYELTELGRDMAEPASMMVEWLDANADRIAAAREHSLAVRAAEHAKAVDAGDDVAPQRFGRR